MLFPKQPKPFLKWAGGKTQLLGEIEKAIPHELTQSSFTYIEPFVGSGAVLFWVLNNFPKLEHAVINDINADLINTYKIIASNPKELIEILEILQTEFHALEGDDDSKKLYYYDKRAQYNTRETAKTEQAALFIFLNKTCFNGLYRVNKNNQHNVPIGSYTKPMICDAPNILLISEALKKVEILCGDYEQTLDYTHKNTLFYFDPPYKPLNNTSNFNAYAKDVFDDAAQIRLQNFCSKLNTLDHKWILSNSDVNGTIATNSFFDDLYHEFSITRVDARRSINASGEKRGKLKELLITNNS
jgi:DNA adenine methylase